MGTFSWNIQTGYVQWDREHEVLWGVKSGEFDNSFESFARNIFAEDRIELESSIAGSIERQRTSWQHEFRVNRGGEVVWIVSSGKFEYSSEGVPRMMRGVVMESTKRKQTEMALKDSQKFLSDLIESVDGVVYEVDASTFQFTYVSRGAEKISGFPASRWIEEKDFWVNHLHPEDRDGAVNYCSSLTEQHKNHRFSYRMIMADGSTRWLDDVVTVIVEGGKPVKLRGILTDITEKVEGEGRYQRINDRFRALIDKNPACIQLLDRDLKTIYASPSVEKLLGVSSDRLVATSMFDYVSLEDEEGLRNRLSALSLIPGKQTSLAWRTSEADGRVASCEGIATNLLDDLAVGAIVLNFRDTTDRVQLEEELRQAQKMEAVGRLAGGVAHDFNNILTIINGYGSLLVSDGNASEEVVRATKEILDAADRAAGLTRQLLAFGRRQVMRPELMDVNRSLQLLFNMLHRIVGENITMTSDLGIDDLYVFADSVMIDQMVMNLVVNAKDAMEGNSGHIKISTGRESMAGETGQVYIEVSDNGMGIPEDYLEKIFEPFFTTKEQGKGTGLGLATVFGVAEQHGGKVTVSSEVGKGTTFRILLPEVQNDSQSNQDTKIDRMRDSVEGGTETILLVEDEKSVRNLIQILLKRAGYEVIVASNGIEAFERWKKDRAKISLVLTDVIMPEGVTGFELASMLRDESEDLRIVFMSGYSADVAGQTLKLDEGQNFVQKPASREDLLSTIRQSLNSDSAATASQLELAS